MLYFVLNVCDKYLQFLEFFAALGDLSFIIHNDTMRMGHLDWYVADQISGDNQLRGRSFANMDGEILRVIRIAVQNRDQLDEILAMFSPY